MSDTAHIFILHGNDIDAIEEQQTALIREQKDSGLSDFNLLLANGKAANYDDLALFAFAAPFISDSRVMILTSPLSLAGGREGNQKFLKFLGSIPETTRLYLILPDEIERKDWAALGKSNFLRKWVDKNPQKGKIITFNLPSQGQMAGWIMKKAVAKGGQFDASGAQALASATGNDTFRASREIDKLLLYVDFSRPVDVDDVNELVTGVISASVFDMVDAMAVGNARTALTQMHRLLEDQELPQLFAMIVRQFRLLIQTRSILDKRGTARDVQEALNVIPFVAEKLCRQANAFSMEKLNMIYDSLLKQDHAFKTSKGDPLASMDLFILNIAGMLKNPTRTQ